MVTDEAERSFSYSCHTNRNASLFRTLCASLVFRISICSFNQLAFDILGFVLGSPLKGLAMF